MKTIKNIIRAAIVLVVLVILFLGYLGLVPGLSHILGSDKARDLGIRLAMENSYSENYTTMTEMIQGSTQIGLPTTKTHAIDIQLTSEEVTALVRKQFMGLDPLVQDLQIKINSDGVIESSGVLNLKKLSQIASDPKLKEVVEYAKNYERFVSTAPFYIRGTGSVTNNLSQINILQVQIGKVTIPLDDETNRSAESLVNRNIRNVIRGLSVTSAIFDQGHLRLVGQVK